MIRNFGVERVIPIERVTVEVDETSQYKEINTGLYQMFQTLADGIIVLNDKYQVQIKTGDLIDLRGVEKMAIPNTMGIYLHEEFMNVFASRIGGGGSQSQYEYIYDDVSSLQPNQFTGLWGWWRFDQGKVIENGDVVEWQDMSGNGLNLTDNIGGLNPPMLDNLNGGRIYFDRDNDEGLFRMNNDLIDAVGVNKFTVCIVCELEDLPADSYMLWIEDGDNGQDHEFLRHVNNWQTGIYTLTDGKTTGTSNVDWSGKKFIMVTFNSDPGYEYMISEINGHQYQSANITANEKVKIDNTLYVGAKSYNSGHWKGWIDEIIIYKDVIAGADRIALQKYIQQQHAINLGF